MNNPAYTREWLMKQLPQDGLGPCAKQTVVAVIETADGRTFAGTNACANPQKECPRVQAGCKTGEGYEMCLDICKQTGHAEKNALEAAGAAARGAVMRVYGHTYACAECTRQATQAGIADLVVGGGFKRLNQWVSRTELPTEEQKRQGIFAIGHATYEPVSHSHSVDDPSTTHYVDDRDWDRPGYAA